MISLIRSPQKQEPQTIPNTNNWLFRLIRKELADYFPDIQTAEDARQELERRKPSAGAKPMNTRYPIVAYGIYRMLHEENAMSENPDTPNELCRLIYDYTRFVGCYPSYKGYDGSFNPKNIRADIGYIKKNVQKYGGEKIPKFPSVEFGRIHIVTDNIVHKDLFWITDIFQVENGCRNAPFFFTYSAETQERFLHYRNGVKESDIKLTNRQIIGIKTPDIVYLERLGKREKMADLCQRNQ